MNKAPTLTFLMIGFSFFLALVLSLFPLPVEYTWLKPNWVLLVLIYWVLSVGSKVGVFTGFCVGLAIDILDDLTLGTTALIFALTAFIAGLFKNKFRVAGPWQHFVILFLIVAFANLMRLWLKMLVGNLPENYSFWVTTLVTIVVWPVVSGLLKTYHKLTIPNPR